MQGRLRFSFRARQNRKRLRRTREGRPVAVLPQHRGPRSATITADEDLKAFGLSEASFAVLCQQQPDLAIKLLTALGRELSVRIRYANMTIQQLET